MIIAEQYIKALLVTFLCVMFWVSLIMGVSGQVEGGRRAVGAEMQELKR